MQDLKGVVVDKQFITEEIFKLKVYLSEKILAFIDPGSFAMLKVEAKGVYLRRPFSFADLDIKTGMVTFYVKVVGRGTKALGEINPGQEISMLLPLGRGFTRRPGKSLLIAGGIGVAPLNFLAKRIIEDGGKVSFLYGVRNARQFIAEIYSKFKKEMEVYCEEPGLGNRGSVRDGLLTKEIMAYDQIYLCGPMGMLKAVKPILKDFPGLIEVSLESYMACGFGACLGCAVQLKNKDGIIYKKVCQDGPVFNFKDVVL
ncbi:dihydroorotate dehydrogenase electron transfer subunit [Carboxydothermus pertinax]|uniref:Dihydroorotate dehydrogenase electron transfer subunit n=1 Tax=Carboxydothermus pertinax TaxID=870242 RepID=A0A1L8CXV6_9THEO|nr:dihydroorotate dehydrogenase electron transfer subunit [Carboxydothermus pertinax]GAV23740.1 dihydroorotate dehydrogenase electron transfer subunit [Carboxydothermus pertinax]